MIAHPKPYFGALYWSCRRFLRISLGLKGRPKVPILSLPVADIVQRHSWICAILRDWLPDSKLWSGHPVCEAGAGDCLAAASMVLGLGASRVTIVEHEPPVTGPKQAEVLAELRKLGFPCDAGIFNERHELNPQKCAYVQAFMENYQGDGTCSLVYSTCVGEHVEDLPAFFASCHRTLAADGRMMHYIDLGGHGIFEDPMPPLEFHRYSDLAYGAIYPRYYRATRRFVRDYLKAASEAGFVEVEAKPVRQADLDYVRSLRPQVHARARAIPDEELSVIEFVLLARKPAA